MKKHFFTVARRFFSNIMFGVGQRFFSFVLLMSMLLSALAIPTGVVGAWHGVVGDIKVNCDGTYTIPVDTNWEGHIGTVDTQKSWGLSGTLPAGVNSATVSYHVEVVWSTGERWSETGTRTATRPTGCVEHTVSITVTPSCSGWTTSVSSSPEGATYSYSPSDNGSWGSNENSVSVTVTATWPDGTVKTASGSATRPDCREYKVTLTLSADCKGWSANASGSVEGATFTYTPGQTGSWGQNETSITVTVVATWPNGKTDSATKSVDKPDCRDYSVRLSVTPSCNGWTASANASVDGATFTFNPGNSGTWGAGQTEITVTVTATWANGKSTTATQTASRPDCTEYKVTVSLNADCKGWSASAASSPDGATYSFSPAQSGGWTEGQTSIVVEVTATWPNGKSAKDSKSVNRPDCTPYSVKISGNGDCKAWSASASASPEGANLVFTPAQSGEFGNGTSVTVSVVATWPNGKTANDSVTIQKKDCGEYTLSLSSKSDCKVWSVSGSSNPEGANIVYEPGSKGDWAKDQKDVKVHAKGTWANGKTAEADITVTLPESCGGPKKPPTHYSPPPKPYECATQNCGPWIDNTPKANEVTFGWTSLAVCNWVWDTVCNGWVNDMEKASIVEMKGTVPFSIFWSGHFIPAEMVSENVYRIENAPRDGTWSLWYGIHEGKWDQAAYENGTLKRLGDVIGREHVKKFILCGFNYWAGDVKDGVIYWKLGSNTWELARYLVTIGYSQKDADALALTAHDTGHATLPAK